jgi:integrase
VGRIAERSLTAKQVEFEKRPGYYADAGCPGLYLQVTEGSRGLARSWLFRFTSPTTQKRREMGLGAAHVIRLSDARNLATNFRLQLVQGLDPLDERRKERAANSLARTKQISFNEAARLCIATKSHEWSNAKHASQWANTLATYASPVLGKLDVSLITTVDVLRVLEPIWLAKTETATRVRQRIETVLDWCTARGHRSGENPARLKGGLGELLPKSAKIKTVEHLAAVPYLRINEFVSTLRKLGGSAPLALEFMLLTATRTSETIMARWSEFDLQSRTWNIPAERMKAGREHRVPLCERAIEIYQIMASAKQNEYVFPGQAPRKNPHLSTGAFLYLFKKMAGFEGYTPHGLRSTFRDWASECTNTPNETLELCLAHTIKNKAEAAYRRQDQLEKRRTVMQLWQQHVNAVIGSTKVLPLKRQSGV